MCIGGVPPTLERELLPVWCVLMVKALCFGSYWDSVSTSDRVIAPRERTPRAVILRDLSRKTKLCSVLATCLVISRA